MRSGGDVIKICNSFHICNELFAKLREDEP